MEVIDLDLFDEDDSLVVIKETKPPSKLKEVKLYKFFLFIMLTLQGKES